MQLRTGKPFSINKRFLLKKIITQISRLTPEIKSPLMDNVNIISVRGKATADLGLWIVEETRFASDLALCQFKTTKRPWFTLGKLNFP